MNTPRVSILLVHYRTPDLTAACLRSLAAHCAVPHEIIVVDNSPGPDGVPRQVAAAVGAQVIDSQENIGFGRGCNLGADHATTETLFLLNTDARLHDDAPAILAAFLDAHPKAGAVGCSLTDANGDVAPSAARFPSTLGILAGRSVVARMLRKRFPRLSRSLGLYYQPEELPGPRVVDWCVGAALMVRRTAFKAVGGFDPRIFLYTEEMDLCRRLGEQGWEVWYTPQARVEHQDAGSSDGELSPRRLAYVAAGHRYYYRKHHGLAGMVWLVLLELTVSLAKGTLWSIAAFAGPKSLRRHRLDKARWHWGYLLNYFRLAY